MAVTYKVELRVVGQSAIQADAPTNSYTANSLVAGTNYEFRARSIDVTSGVTLISAWSAWFAFQTLTPSMIFTLDAAVEAESASALSFTTDAIKPVITLTGDNPTLVIQGGTYTELGATASDNVDGDVTGSIGISGTVDANTYGIYDVTYTVTDTAGNTAEEIRKVHVAPVQAVASYSVEYREIGQGSTIVADISSPTYAISGLTPNANYEFRVRAHGNAVAGAWSDYVQFTTTALGTTAFTLGAASEIETASALSTSITGDGSFSIAAASEIESASALVFTQSSGLEVEADTWVIELLNVATGAVSTTSNHKTKSLALAGLDIHSEYRFRVQGWLGPNSSDWTVWFGFITDASGKVITPTTTSAALLDHYEVTVQATADEVEETLLVTGTVTHGDSDVTIEFNNHTITIPSETLTHDTELGLWTFHRLIGGNLTINGLDELAEPEYLIINSAGDFLKTEDIFSV